MKKKIRNLIKLKQSNKKAFSLFEVIMAIALVAIIGAFAGQISTGMFGKGSKKNCVLQILSIQDLVRTEARNQGLTPSESFDSSSIIGVGKDLEEAKCPDTGNAYSLGSTVPVVGTMFATCPDGHEPLEKEKAGR